MIQENIIGVKMTVITKLMCSFISWGRTLPLFKYLQVQSWKKYLSSHVLCQAVEKQWMQLIVRHTRPQLHLLNQGLTNSEWKQHIISHSIPFIFKSLFCILTITCCNISNTCTIDLILQFLSILFINYLPACNNDDIFSNVG